jgi:2-oxoglutarate ferredoxin oxidoreductase subunit alpha
MEKDLSILIGGEAGQGTRLAGNLIANLFNKLGYFVYVYEDYQSLIRGGHNFSEIRVAGEKREARKKEIDVLIAFDKNTIFLHQKRLKKDGLLIFNADRIEQKKGIGIFGDKIIKEEGGIPQMINTVFISALAKALGISFEILESVLKEKIKRGIDLNLKIAKRVYETLETKTKVAKIRPLASSLLLTGNEACALGMARAGLEFYFAYPMTPSTSILNFLAQKEEEFKVKTFQPESEIAVINMAIGSAFAGKRSAVGSSGGGFALMVEALSLAAQTETPILIVESQRAGPSTGMPTYNLQGDLDFVLGAGHGDVTKFVLQAGNAQDALFLGNLGLNLAWRYQTPVILLLDKDVSENTFSVDSKIFKSLKIEKPKLFFGKNYQRYKITKDGISPLAFPGSDFIVKANSYEHDESGITTDDEKIVQKMQEKRKRKFESMEKEVEKLGGIEVFGKKSAKVAIFPLGISKGVAIELAKEFNFKVIFPWILKPFPEKKVKEELKGVKKVFTLEMNATGQLANYLKRFGILAKPILKYTGRPFFIDELREKFKKYEISN